MIEQNNMRRNRHNEEVMFDELTATIERIDSVAAFTGKTFEQVADLYRTQAIDRGADRRRRQMGRQKR